MALFPPWFPPLPLLSPLHVPSLPHPLPPTWPFSSLQQPPSSSAAFFPPSTFSSLLQPYVPLPNAAFISYGTHQSNWVVSLDFFCGNPTSSISSLGMLGTSCNIFNESIKVARNLSNIHYVMEQKNQPLDWFTYLSSPCIWWTRHISCTIRVCHLAWIAAKLESSKRPTR